MITFPGINNSTQKSNLKKINSTLFKIMGVAAGGAACSRRSSRRRLNNEPPLYIDVYPYITWIINVITAHVLPRPYSHNFRLVEGGSS